MKINLSENSKIYLVCPANFATGGTEGIHQLAFKLQKLGFPRVFLFYLNTTQDNPVHPQFEKYQIKRKNAHILRALHRYCMYCLLKINSSI